jgi:rubrerythrin
MKIRSNFVKGVHKVKKTEELHQYLQLAIKLEHSTIPPYLTALYSIKPNFNQQAYQLIFSIVREEMLHFTIAANVLNAINGKPNINHPEFIPNYPGPLPMNIGDDLIVGLAPLSKDTVLNTFMRIEQGDDPVNFPVESGKKKSKSEEKEQPDYTTIGDFYEAIIDKLEELGNKIFTGNPQKQVVNEQWFPSDELFLVTNVKEARKALDIIVQQGEGRNNGKYPFDQGKNLAHYYQLAEIYNGRKLQRDPKAPGGFSYTGEVIPLDPNGIYDLVKNSQADKYAPGTIARRMVDQFNYCYTAMLHSLHLTFNEEPNYLNAAIGIMFDLKLQAQKMAEIIVNVDGVDKCLAPSFEYAPTNANLTQVKSSSLLA